MPTAAIALSSVRKVYGDGPAATVALDGVDLAIAAGRFVSLIGPSGCGKSTLLRLVAGLEPADRGTVAVHGVTPDEACAAKLIGFVPQAPALLPWLSVLRNVTLPQKINRGAARQRAAIVRAFGLRPDVLLMDEPFSALDEFTRESLQDQLLELWGEGSTTVLFVTHNIAEAVRLSDTVVVMAAGPGRIVESVDIGLPRPRGQQVFAERGFHEYEDLIREKLRGAWRSPDAA